MSQALRSMRCPHSRLILHWRGLGKNSQLHAVGSKYCRPTVQAPQKLNFGTFYTANGEIRSALNLESRGEITGANAPLTWRSWVARMEKLTKH